MKATQCKLLQALENDPQPMISFCHSAYSWPLKEYQKLWTSSLRIFPKPLGIRYQRNGDLALDVATMNEALPYALGLIRQSLERQLDNDKGSN